MVFDLVLKGGHVIDPKNGIDEAKDVGIQGGKIAAVDAGLPVAGAGKVVDVGGLYVTPGLVDIHMHAYATAGNPDQWAGDNSILPDGFSFRTGVTTMVDTGSAGWRNFADFRERGDRPLSDATLRANQYCRNGHDRYRARAESARYGYG